MGKDKDIVENCQKITLKVGAITSILLDTHMTRVFKGFDEGNR